MSRFARILAACAIVTASLGALAETPNISEVLQVALDLSDGSRVIGTPDIKSVPMQTTYAKRRNRDRHNSR